MKVERRQHRRYPLPVDEMFLLGRYSNNVATVKDIGEGGLKFEYLTGNFAADQWSLVDIVAGRRDRVLVSAVRCQICYDIGNLLENGTFTGKEVRSCGLRFVALTDDQKKGLHRLVARRDVYNGDWT